MENPSANRLLSAGLVVFSKVQSLRKFLPIIGALVLSGCACGEEPAGYYATAEGKTGPALRQALHDIIDGHQFLEYTRTDEAMALTDRDPDNPGSVILIYSRRTEPASCCTGEWNREHVWPNSFGIDSNLPAHSDLHNLRPSDYDVNQRRGHKYFDESDEAAQSYQEPAHNEAPLSSADFDSWEPPESIKGDIARAMFYMAIRYEGGPGEPDLELTDDVSEISTTNDKMGRLTTLLVWHLIDPVSDIERERNEGVFVKQGNRNPFVDHPEWVNEIWPSPLQLDLDGVGNGDSVTLTWPAEIPRSAIQYSADLANWLDLDEVPQRVGETLTLNQSIAIEARRFYRLVIR